MQWKLIPSRACVVVLTCLGVGASLALLAGLPALRVGEAVAAVLGMALLWAVVDVWRSRRAWRRAPLRIERRLPTAFALGVPRVLTLTLVNEGAHPWHVAVFDEVDAKFAFHGLPQTQLVPAGARADMRYTLTPLRRGLTQLGQTQVRWRTLGGCFEVWQTLGQASTLHVYPNFAALAGYAWLAGDKRLAQIGIKTYAQRGLGTDFRQLAEYQRGDPVRHIDWKATLRYGKPVVRQYQDERDQCVVFLLDCGRRMRADEGTTTPGGSHFDQVLNALMLLSYVALKEGDEVGAMTFGTPAGQERHFAPRKGTATLHALMNRLHDIEPTATHSDYLMAAEHFTRIHHKRALVIVLTNFRDEDATELSPALTLLRKRHLVLVASLRERVLREIADQPVQQAGDAAEVAAAHLFEQSRRDAFARALGNDALSLDVEPADLAVGLVNRYHAVKRAGLL
jgi:uncharacterized protein (DUF58 family)